MGKNFREINKQAHEDLMEDLTKITKS